MKLVTFNIRCSWDKDGINNFLHRAGGIACVIKSEKPDVVCFQECTDQIYDLLKTFLPDYHIVFNQRNADLKGEGLATALRKDSAELLGLESFWLSPTPYVPGSRYEIQSDCPRVCAEATFHHLETNTVFRVINTHLDHVGHLARLLGVEQIIKKMKEEPFFPDAPCIFVGDMNALPDSEEMAYVTEHTGMVDVTRDIGHTYHGFMKDTPVKIDYIFADPRIRCSSVCRWEVREGNVFISDHYPVCAELELL